MTDPATNLPELDGPGPRSSGMEPEPCYCQSQGRYAKECLGLDDCVGRATGGLDPEDWPPEAPLEIRFHHAIPGWCKVFGLHIREIPECEGGGYMVREDQARMIVAASHEAAKQSNGPQGFGDAFIAAKPYKPIEVEK